MDGSSKLAATLSRLTASVGSQWSPLAIGRSISITVPGEAPAMFIDHSICLQGWKVRSISCGGRHTVVAADDSVIVWGTGTSSGELVSHMVNVTNKFL